MTGVCSSHYQLFGAYDLHTNHWRKVDHLYMAKPNHIFVHQHLQVYIQRKWIQISTVSWDKVALLYVYGLRIISHETSYRDSTLACSVNKLQKWKWKLFKFINHIDFIHQKGAAFHSKIMCKAERKHDFLVSQKNDGSSFCSQVGRMTNSNA